MSHPQKPALQPALRPSRAVLWGVLAVWCGSTLAGMWWLNPVSPATLSVCSSPPVSLTATLVAR
nr:hypothetical protein [uncultured Albidiferax sp.]